ncbi:DKNYY domain-containing protein [Croceimicrobium hydrocarbonivorans]|uniref:DKNYY domain-containing protein n=1 Tax=Croceimicrobium hydrocarbonivorans TaxID=2761580 RepID=A0A7H0VHB4_9FLAO|nr:DKNYY domain-containing protein [Croceimicrobium hydrocarbonivorans]QNR25112.1 DKNYY domain-containing protein [Croceimicrobium hydrocarbonivorans]
MKKLEHVKLNIYRNTIDSSLVYETFAVDIGKVYHPVPNNLNIETANDYGEWLIDDRTVFAWYNTSDGRLLNELEIADRATFLVLDSSIYGKDKNHVYDTRHGIIEKADLETFEAVKIEVDGRVAYAKDKDNYFFWDEIVTDTLGFAKEYRKLKIKNEHPTKPKRH